ncbi:MAG: hydrogenase expression/formation protein HypE [Sorangiineae bacterium PRO1]|nr:hydrogenase expression/formation protein HypE [Sorangiineae bacterium PRO1]
MSAPDDDELGACPLPFRDYDRVVIGHGGGGTLAAELLRQVFLPAFDSPVLGALEDSAVLGAEPGRIALTTDAFVVKPRFFPGGDLGRLAVAGTVNDLACVGARPAYISAAFILEGGLALAAPARLVASMRDTAREAGVALVAGDTKVVERGSGDGVFIVTTGVGFVPEGRAISVSGARPGDRVLVSGTLGDHGIAVMSQRSGIETSVVSDCAPLGDLAERLLSAAPGTRVLRDPTRGGLTGVLHEIARASRVGFTLDESQLPIHPEVNATCELLGFDPLHLANEGKLVAVVPEDEHAAALAALRSHPRGARASSIGHVSAERPGFVCLRSAVGGTRVLTELSGEQLPRIC